MGFEYSRAYGQFYVPDTYKCPPQAKIFKDFSTQKFCVLKSLKILCCFQFLVQMMECHSANTSFSFKPNSNTDNFSQNFAGETVCEPSTPMGLADHFH